MKGNETMTKAANDPARAEQQKKYDAALAGARKLTEAAAEAHAKTMTDKAGVPLTQRYRDAVREFRIAYAQLAADDRRCNRSGFGVPPDVATHLRHALANPNEGGSIADDIATAFAKAMREGI
jgi:hypothetical protein